MMAPINISSRLWKNPAPQDANGVEGRVACIHQPNYMPWLGFFAKIIRADVFVVMDNVQFPKNSWTNRVQVVGSDGPR